MYLEKQKDLQTIQNEFGPQKIKLHIKEVSVSKSKSFDVEVSVLCSSFLINSAVREKVCIADAST